MIDPITAYLGTTDSYKDATVRGVLAPLLALIDQHACVLVWVAHLTKAEERKALYRPGGSIAFVAASRVVLVAGERPEEPGRIVLAQGKNNLAPKARSLTLPGRVVGRIVWGDTVPFTADQILSKPIDPRDVELASTAAGVVQTLRKEYPDGVIDAREAFARGELVGIPKRTLRHAARRAGLLPFRQGKGKEHRSLSIDLKASSPVTEGGWPTSSGNGYSGHSSS